MQPGFSGLQVSRVCATGLSESEIITAHWLLKWGRPIYKLAEEAVAHRRYFKCGLDRALQIPQLHPNVIAWNGIGYLAYAFESDAKTALVVAKEDGLGCFRPADPHRFCAFWARTNRDRWLPRLRSTPGVCDG